MSGIPEGLEDETVTVQVTFQTDSYDLVDGVSKFNGMKITEGTLELYNPWGFVIAVYAPGIWACASAVEVEAK